MAILHLLGTGASVTDPHRTATMLAFENEHSLIVVDCGGDVVQRLRATGIGREKLVNLNGLIITHEHPDHVSGFPLFMLKIWLYGRTHPIPIYGIPSAIAQAQRALAAYDTSGFATLPPLVWHEVTHEEGAVVLEDENWRVTAAPGTHSVPVVGLRVEDREDGGVVAYSCDTKPSLAIARLAEGADILVHEANCDITNHSTAMEAALIAREADAKRLLLVHVPPEEVLTEEMMVDARALFEEMEKGEELGRYEF